MLPSFILSLREGLEAALIIGIVLASLRQMRRRDLASAIWAGTGSAALLSLLAAILLTRLGLELKDPGEAIFEGITMLLAAGILTWMIFWMSQRSRTMKADIESSVLHASQDGKWSMFGLAFIAVLREGVELALFLTAATFSSSTPQTILGGLLGTRDRDPAWLVVLCDHGPTRFTAFLPGDGLPAAPVRGRAGGTKRGGTGAGGLDPRPDRACLGPGKHPEW